MVTQRTRGRDSKNGGEERSVCEGGGMGEKRYRASEKLFPGFIISLIQAGIFTDARQWRLDLMLEMEVLVAAEGGVITHEEAFQPDLRTHFTPVIVICIVTIESIIDTVLGTEI